MRLAGGRAAHRRINVSPASLTPTGSQHDALRPRRGRQMWGAIVTGGALRDLRLMAENRFAVDILLAVDQKIPGTSRQRTRLR